MLSPGDTSAIRAETILVVEDDHTVQKALKRLFEFEGYKVETCSDGQSAIDTYKTVEPTAVVLDLGLPVVSGEVVLREIRREAQLLPIVVVTAVSDDDAKTLMLELGADDYVTKPFSPRELLARVKSAICRTSYLRG